MCFLVQQRANGVNSSIPTTIIISLYFRSCIQRNKTLFLKLNANHVNNDAYF